MKLTLPNLRSERGSALLLAVLMLVTMTSLGLLAVTSAKMEVAIAGNFRTIKQAQYIAEAGLIAVGQMMQGDPASFARSLKGPNGLNLEWDTDYFGSNNVFVTEADRSHDRSMGYDSRPIGFRVWVESYRDLSVCPGYSTGTSCCMRVSLVSEGRVGLFSQDDLPMAGVGGARRRVRAEYSVPYPCAK